MLVTGRTLLTLGIAFTALVSVKCFGDINPGVLQTIEAKNGKALSDAVKTRESGLQDPDRDGAPHFLPSSAVQGMLSISKNLPLGLFGLKPDSLAVENAPATVTAISDVLFYGDRQTRGGEDKLFTSAFQFYSELRKRDAATPPKGGWEGSSPIQTKSQFNAYTEIALPIAHGNPYLALKTLLVFGQDRTYNGLLPIDSSRISILNDLNPGSLTKPRITSLYFNGAIGPAYSEADVTRGMAIAKACTQYELTFEEQGLCNDNFYNYEADYYHVITAAFLGCRQAILSKQDTSFINKIAMSSGLADSGYLDSVRSYKFDRFKEHLEPLPGSMPESKAKSVLRSSFAKGYDPTSHKPLDLDREQWDHLNDHDKQAVRAILDRYNFEIEFRARQHEMGLKFGRQLCKDMRTFEDVPKNQSVGSTANEDTQDLKQPAPNGKSALAYEQMPAKKRGSPAQRVD